MLSNQFRERGVAKDTLFLAPYCQRGHWMLIMVNPVALKIWYLDPLNGEPSNREDMVVLFNEAVVLYRTATDMTVSPKMRAFESSEKWVTVKCPFQPDQSNDCGYCLMKFMKDIITHAPTTLSNKYFEDVYCVRYSTAHVEEVLEEVAQCVFNMWVATVVRPIQ
ncbi:uncharacterized protein LOC129317889 [Prosopis cineraria]|uniref:uncharacterized protein LOC129317889 n=1 Tax=Prosopis cineraria TaxID=364024 RepID=UPI00241046CC|nr:uncharacterized protein LOC129317889 [Prosopis cineraria]